MNKIEENDIEYIDRLEFLKNINKNISELTNNVYFVTYDYCSDFYFVYKSIPKYNKVSLVFDFYLIHEIFTKIKDKYKEVSNILINGINRYDKIREKINKDLYTYSSYDFENNEIEFVVKSNEYKNYMFKSKISTLNDHHKIQNEQDKHYEYCLKELTSFELDILNKIKGMTNYDIK